MYKLMKVFDINHPRAPKDIWEISNTISMEFGSGSNDSYYYWCIVENPTGEEQGGGWASDEEVRLLNDWLIKLGAEIGDEVLVYHWW